ncbi:hypothetical protein QA634_08920 [Methylobacterium sp. CB376]|uniref:hypothetical protein n=1 Tax=unclassified Methylobacterium TaxID=2615210 RepID=UPI00143BE9CF|nr:MULTISPECIES: hypothetical protein [Methylobacterium]WFT81962.1 hypothetical protein QA634_08920 [Methylobacterium nodulans]
MSEAPIRHPEGIKRIGYAKPARRVSEAGIRMATQPVGCRIGSLCGTRGTDLDPGERRAFP